MMMMETFLHCSKIFSLNQLTRLATNCTIPIQQLSQFNLLLGEFHIILSHYSVPR